MSKLVSFAAAFIVAAAALAPATSEARIHHRYHHRHHHGLPYAISFLHNYGPGPMPGTFAVYDGPSTNHCYQSSSAYIGQDRRRHPCF